MSNFDLYIFIAVIAPLSLMMFVFRGKQKVILGYVMAGILVCMLAGVINTKIYNAMSISYESFCVNVSPFVEEILKAFFIFLLVFVFHPKRQFVLECSIAIGVGFALLENLSVFASSGESLDMLVVLSRGFGTGFMHGISCFLVGYFAELFYRRRRLIIPGTIITLLIAVIYHGIYNAIVLSSYRVLGIAFPLVTFLPIGYVIMKKRIWQWKAEEAS